MRGRCDSLETLLILAGCPLWGRFCRRGRGPVKPSISFSVRREASAKGEEFE